MPKIGLLDYRKAAANLRKAGAPVDLKSRNSEEFQQNLAEMKKILLQDGVGLAATQVNWPVMLFMLNITSNGDQLEEPEIFLNPRILSSSKETSELEEGCLSFPGLFFKVKRPTEIVWQFETLAGEKRTVTSTGFYARAVQHEIDHLNGKVFIDHASSAVKLKINKWLKA